MGAERGFTFVEVLVVMVVLSFGVLGVLQTTLLAARLERRSEAITRATFLAQERLERIGALGWERATAGLRRRRCRRALGGQALLQEGVRPAGASSSPSSASRRPPSRRGARCTATGRAGSGGFDRRNVVRLSLRRRR